MISRRSRRASQQTYANGEWLTCNPANRKSSSTVSTVPQQSSFTHSEDEYQKDLEKTIALSLGDCGTTPRKSRQCSPEVLDTIQGETSSRVVTPGRRAKSGEEADFGVMSAMERRKRQRQFLAELYTRYDIKPEKRGRGSPRKPASHMKSARKLPDLDLALSDESDIDKGMENDLGTPKKPPAKKQRDVSQNPFSKFAARTSSPSNFRGPSQISSSSQRNAQSVDLLTLADDIVEDNDAVLNDVLINDTNGQPADDMVPTDDFNDHSSPLLYAYSQRSPSVEIEIDLSKDPTPTPPRGLKRKGVHSEISLDSQDVEGHHPDNRQSGPYKRPSIHSTDKHLLGDSDSDDDEISITSAKFINTTTHTANPSLSLSKTLNPSTSGQESAKEPTPKRKYTLASRKNIDNPTTPRVITSSFLDISVKPPQTDKAGPTEKSANNYFNTRKIQSEPRKSRVADPQDSSDDDVYAYGGTSHEAGRKPFMNRLLQENNMPGSSSSGASKRTSTPRSRVQSLSDDDEILLGDGKPTNVPRTATFPCPICGNHFSGSEINTHAYECDTAPGKSPTPASDLESMAASNIAERKKSLSALTKSRKSRGKAARLISSDEDENDRNLDPDNMPGPSILRFLDPKGKDKPPAKDTKTKKTPPKKTPLKDLAASSRASKQQDKTDTYPQQRTQTKFEKCLHCNQRFLQSEFQKHMDTQHSESSNQSPPRSKAHYTTGVENSTHQDLFGDMNLADAIFDEPFSDEDTHIPNYVAQETQPTRPREEDLWQNALEDDYGYPLDDENDMENLSPLEGFQPLRANDGNDMAMYFKQFDAVTAAGMARDDEPFENKYTAASKPYEPKKAWRGKGRGGYRKKRGGGGQSSSSGFLNTSAPKRRNAPTRHNHYADAPGFTDRDFSMQWEGVSGVTMEE
ncbi:hypothetical protein DFS34DRAFT_601053 [Phlyctochytrium arcticum]|nr:hypothetical protein DFS34DRAFT_601053 [Phlyctochytrium arcticum]